MITSVTNPPPMYMISLSFAIGPGPPLVVAAVPQHRKQKKPTWQNTLRYSPTSAYSLTSPPARPGCPLSSHPTTSNQLASRAAFKFSMAPLATSIILHGSRKATGRDYCSLNWGTRTYTIRLVSHLATSMYKYHLELVAVYPSGPRQQGRIFKPAGHALARGRTRNRMPTSAYILSFVQTCKGA
jgi:hypothetical protein